MPMSMTPMTPAEKARQMDSLNTLHQMMVPPSPDAAPQGFTANTPVQLAGLRHEQEGEFQDRANAGDPRAALELKQVQQDQHDDPYTGDAAQTLTDFFDPQQQRKSQIEQAQKIDLATAPQKVAGEYGLKEQQIKNQGALDVQGKKNDILANNQVHFDADGNPHLPLNNKPLDAQSERSNTALHEGAPLIGELENILSQQPSGNVGNAIANKLAYGLYHMGVSPEAIGGIPGIDANTQKRMQVAGLLKVIGASPYAAGSRNFQFLKQAQEHLTDPSASNDFLRSQIQEIKRIWPMLQQEIISSHVNPSGPLNFNAPGGDDAQWEDVAK